MLVRDQRHPHQLAVSARESPESVDCQNKSREQCYAMTRTLFPHLYIKGKKRSSYARLVLKSDRNGRMLQEDNWFTNRTFLGNSVTSG